VGGGGFAAPEERADPRKEHSRLHGLDDVVIRPQLPDLTHDRCRLFARPVSIRIGLVYAGRNRLHIVNPSSPGSPRSRNEQVRVGALHELDDFIAAGSRWSSANPWVSR